MSGMQSTTTAAGNVLPDSEHGHTRALERQGWGAPPGMVSTATPGYCVPRRHVEDHQFAYPDTTRDDSAQAVLSILGSRYQDRADDTLQYETRHTLRDIMQELVHGADPTHDRHEPHPFTIEVVINRARCSDKTDTAVVKLAAMIAQRGRATHISTTLLTGARLPRIVEDDLPLLEIRKHLVPGTEVTVEAVRALTEHQVGLIAHTHLAVMRTDLYLDTASHATAAAQRQEDSAVDTIVQEAVTRGERIHSDFGFPLMSAIRWAYVADHHGDALTVEQFKVLTAGWRAAH